MDKQERLEITNLIRIAVAQERYEINVTDCHTQKLRRDRVNSSLDIYLKSNGYELIMLKIRSTVECFFYNKSLKTVINVIKEGTYQGIKRSPRHYLRSIMSINDKTELGQVYWFHDSYGINKYIRADNMLASLYNRIGHNQIDCFLTIVFDHREELLHNVEFCIFNSDCVPLESIKEEPRATSYNPVMVQPNIKDNSNGTVSKRNLKLKKTAVINNKIKSDESEDSKKIK